MLKIMKHSEYQKNCKSLSDAELRYIIDECQQVIKLQQDFNPNCGYYQDEIHYCAMELNRRSK